MNLLVVGKFYREGFGLHIAETLEAMGHTVKRFEPGYRSGRIGGQLGHRIDQVGQVLSQAADSLPALRARRMKALWTVAEQTPLDLVIVIHDFLWPVEVKELKRRTGAAVALWFPDHLAGFGRGFFMNAPYDGLFFKDPFILHALSDVLASPAYYLPECFNPAKHVLNDDQADKLEEYRCDITTAGSQHSYRVAFFKHLVEHNVKIWGAPAPLWMNTGPVAGMFQGRPVFNQDKARAFRNAKIVLNNLHYGEVWGVNVRTFEVAGIGAFQLVDWRPGLAQLFADGKELISFNGIRDLKEKINYWLPREEERHEIAQAGKARAYREHTYQLRLQLLLDTVGGRAHGFPLPAITTLGPAQ
jgi:spore maturation protein CgeB